MNRNNFFSDIPQNLPEELFETILQNNNVRIQRIISDGHTSPPGFWHDQDQNEFVMVLKGNTILEFEDGATQEMGEGDYQIIPAHKKHRVSYTDNSIQTIWLAVHF